MLTKELLQYTRGNRRIQFKFLPATPPVLDMCGNLLAIYHQALKRRLVRAALDEALEPVLKAGFAPKLAAGLNKIILDHTEFISGAGEADLAARRDAVFKRAAAILKSPPADFQRYRSLVEAAGPEIGDLYGDLPDYDALNHCPDWTPGELRNRYNVGLVQGGLLYARDLELELEAAAPMELRKFMRRLKFFRLLAEVEKCGSTKVKLRLSGPGAIFGENRKYGLQLAAFFPVLLLMKNWKMRAMLELRDNAEAETLSLSSSHCDLQGTYQRWSSYVPEEVALFLKAFCDAVPEWREKPDAKLPKVPGEGSLFPDFSFERKDMPGKIVHIELFHRWHAAPLDARLQWLENAPETPLVIGVDRGLLGRAGEADFLTRHPQFELHGFFFSNYPGVDRVRRMLDAVAARLK